MTGHTFRINCGKWYDCIRGHVSVCRMPTQSENHRAPLNGARRRGMKNANCHEINVTNGNTHKIICNDNNNNGRKENKSKIYVQVPIVWYQNSNSELAACSNDDRRLNQWSFCSSMVHDQKRICLIARFDIGFADGAQTPRCFRNVKYFAAFDVLWDV